MSVLPDFQIHDRCSNPILAVEQQINVKPYEASNVQPSSLDVRLDSKFRVARGHQHTSIDPREPDPDLWELVETDTFFVLHPGEFVLGQVLEWISLPNDITARLEGKSSIGRVGLIIHSTAGYIDPGYQGHLTLEMFNLAKVPIKLYPGMLIGQISFQLMAWAVKRPYEGKYQGATEPEASKGVR